MIDIKGQKYGKLIVLEFHHLSKSHHAHWKCKCECGNETIVSARFLRNGQTKSCGCSHKRTRDESPNWRGHGGISLSKFNKIKREAKRREIKFNITIQFLWKLFEKQKGKCALSGETLTFNSKDKKFDGSASVDRIDSNKGYTEDNVHWVHKDVNTMKWDLSLKRFLELVSKIQHNLGVKEAGSSATLSMW